MTRAMRYFLFLIVSIFATTANAQDILSCEGRQGDFDQEREIRALSTFYPTIIIDERDNTVTFVYTAASSQIKTVYKIVRNKETLVAVEFPLTEDKADVSILHYDKKSKQFERFWSAGSGALAGWFGGSFSTGKCDD